MTCWSGLAELWNAYGPTETTIYSTMIQVTAPVGDQVPIGTPLAGERAYVLDRAGRMLPAGTPGELWIGGAGVATRLPGPAGADRRGLLPTDPPGGRRYRTGDLARWRPDGTLDFLGRRDQQVKVRGHRIELGEIETVLRESVADAAVTVYGGDHLVGYLAAPPGTDTGDLERRLISRLPDYMVPRRWMLLDALPVTASGKVDRTALPEPGGRPRGCRRAPRPSCWSPRCGPPYWTAPTSARTTTSSPSAVTPRPPLSWRPG